MVETFETIDNSTLNSILLERQWISKPFTGSPLDLIKSHGVIQTQERWAGAQFFISRGLPAKSYDELRKSEQAVKATLHRITVHSMATDDFHKWQPAYAEKMIPLMRKEGFGLSANWREDVRDALGNGEYKRKEIAQKLDDTLPTFNPPFHIMGYLGLTRVPGDNGADLGHNEKWTLSTWAELTEESIQEAKTDLMRRYLAAFGPALPGDFTSWSNIPAAAGILESMKDELWIGKNEKGQKLYDLKYLSRTPTHQAPEIAVLPSFDNIVLGYGNRDRIAPLNQEQKDVYFKNSMAPILVNGYVGGVWRIKTTRGQCSTSLHELSPMTCAQQKLAQSKIEELMEITRF